MIGVDIVGVGKHTLAAIAISVLTASSNAIEDSMCIGIRSSDELSKTIRYSLLDELVRFDLDIDSEDKIHQVAGAALYYGVPKGVVSYDSLEDEGNILQAPLELTLRDSRLHASIFTRREFEPFVVALVLEPKEDFRSHCVQYELLNVSRSRIDFSRKFGEVTIAK